MVSPATACSSDGLSHFDYEASLNGASAVDSMLESVVGRACYNQMDGIYAAGASWLPVAPELLGGVHGATQCGLAVSLAVLGETSVEVDVVFVIPHVQADLPLEAVSHDVVPARSGTDDCVPTVQVCRDAQRPHDAALEQLLLLAKEACDYARAADERASRNEMGILETRSEISDMAKLIRDKPDNLGRGIQVFFENLLACPAVRRAVKLPITSWEEFTAGVCAAVHAQGTRAVADAIPIRPHAVNLTLPSADRKGHAPPCRIPGTLPFDAKMVTEANRLISWLFDESEKPQMTSYWIHMHGHPEVRVTGLVLRSVASGLSDLDAMLCDAAARLLNRAAALMQKDANSRPPRVYLSASFVLRCLGDLRDDIPLVEMLDEKHIGFDILRSHEFVALVPVGDGWSCYSWDIINLRFSLIDPTSWGKTVYEVSTNHGRNLTLINDKLLNALHTLHGRP